MDKHTFKEMAELYPDKREYFLDLHERYELKAERMTEVQRGYEALGLNKEDIQDGVRVPKKFLKLLQWYLIKDIKATPGVASPAIGIEQKRVLDILKTLFELEG